MSTLDDIVDSAEIIVSCGSGGVGKTTTAAAIAVHAAAIGKRVVVVTIDPARRLADAFGLVDGLTNDPTRVKVPVGVTESADSDPAAPHKLEGGREQNPRDR